MCGIVGYVGPRAALPLLMGGLRRLEYRGYDSAGVAVQPNGALRNPQSGRCLDDPGSSTVDGTQLQLFDCNTTAAQQWTLPAGA